MFFHEWPLRNVLLGVSAENDEWAQKRIPDLLSIAWPFHWVSYEPALGSIHWRSDWFVSSRELYIDSQMARKERRKFFGDFSLPEPASDARLNWVVYGGESTQGKKARPSNVEWAMATRDFLQGYRIPYFCKQMGSNPVCSCDYLLKDEALEWPYIGESHVVDGLHPIRLNDKKGDKPEEWPQSLRIRQFPTRQTRESAEVTA